MSDCYASEQSAYDVCELVSKLEHGRPGPMFTAVMGGVLGVLLEAQLRALRGPMEGAPL